MFIGNGIISLYVINFFVDNIFVAIKEIRLIIDRY